MADGSVCGRKRTGTRIRSCKAWDYLHLGNAGDFLGEDDLQKKNAQRENTYFASGVIPEVDELDNHAVHAEEHRRFALGMEFRLLERKSPEYAGALRAHLKQHEQIIAREEAEKMARALAAQGAR